MEYVATPAPDSDPKDGTQTGVLDYATSAEKRWWKALAAKGIGWKVQGETLISRWTVSLDNGLGLDIIDCDEFDENESPPSAAQAASYLGRLCEAFDLGDQMTIALATAVCIPFHESRFSPWPASIELPRTTLGRRGNSSPGKRKCLPQEFHLLNYLMTLSLSFTAVGCTLWSVFWNSDVPCNSVGAWFEPISAVPCPLIERKDIEILVRIISYSSPKVAPLWIGSALLGPTSIIRRVPKYLKLCDYVELTGPDPTMAAWTGVPHSFLDGYRTTSCQDSTVSRADVCRLRREFHTLYEEQNFKYSVPHCWPPLGRMREEDVELEIRDHICCSHHWEYAFWTWSTGVTNAGFSKYDQLELPQPNLLETEEKSCVHKDGCQGYNVEAS